MRKYMLFGASMLLLALAACTRENEVVTGPEKLSFKAVVDDGATRTAYENDKTASWVAGDQISVYVTNGTDGQVVTFTADESQTFTGTAPAGYTTIVAGAYPADANHTFDATGLKTLNFPASYTLAEGADPASIQPLAGTFVEGVMTFRHPAGALKFTIDNVPATAVRFRFTTFGHKINGSYALDADLEDTLADAEKSVDINFPAAAGSHSFYVPMPAGELYPESVIELFDADDKLVFKKVAPQAITVTKNVIKRIAAVSGWTKNEEWQAAYLRDVYISSTQKFGSYVQITGTTGLYDNALYATSTFNNMYGSVEGFLASNYIPNQKANGRQPRDHNLTINYNRLSPGSKTVVIYGLDENYNFTGEYNIVEFEVPEFTTPEGWSITFYPQYNSSNYGIVPAVNFKNTGGTWQYNYMTKEVYASYGSDPAVFIWYKRTATNALLTKTSATYTFSTLAPGEYVFIAYGMNERVDDSSDRTPTFEYCVIEVNYESPSEAYQSWIGKWSVTDDTPKTDTWTISAKSNNYTYNVAGLGGNAGITTEALFDAETGNLKFKAQKDFQTIVKDGEERQICLYGTNGSSYWTGTYDLMYAAYDDETGATATLTASDPEKYLKYKLYGFVDGKSKYNYGTRTLPSTMVREETSSVMLPDGWSVTAVEGDGMEAAPVLDGTEVAEEEAVAE